jgi:hypothetical protein
MIIRSKLLDEKLSLPIDSRWWRSHLRRRERRRRHGAKTVITLRIPRFNALNVKPFVRLIEMECTSCPIALEYLGFRLRK